MTRDKILISAEQVEQAIRLVRGQKVMLDSDLAALYGVETSNLNKAVKRTWPASRRISCFNSRPTKPNV